MATVTHVIRSQYDTADRERLERETGQLTDDASDPWQTESSFSAQCCIRSAPTFVPATISYDEWGVPLRASPPQAAQEKPAQASASTAEWYRSLTTASSSRAPPTRPSSAPGPLVQDVRPPLGPCPKSTARQDWFISKALRSEPSTKPSSPAPSPSLADLLARDPPPLPSEGRYSPPVWLHIGPSNRGFGMLQRSGWREGQGLGAHVVRQVVRERDDNEHTPSSTPVKTEKTVANVQNSPEVIDLTLSDSEASGDLFDDDNVISESVQTQASASHVRISLLTPLPTVLKADRLGIGLKAKKEGPYKRSRKRVTHSAAALAAHIRSAEEVRRTKLLVGKGKQGFAKIHKREEDRRKAMLAYLNE